MARGRPKKPLTALKVAGTYRESRHATRGDQVRVGGVPVCPSHLSGEALAHWRENVPKLVEAGIVGALDSAALTAMCEQWALYRASMNELKKKPKDWTTITKTITFLKSWRVLASAFGLESTSRSKLSPFLPPNSVEDPFEKFLKARGKSG